MNTCHVITVDGEVSHIILSPLPDVAWKFVKKALHAKGTRWHGWFTPDDDKVEVFVVHYRPRLKNMKYAYVIKLGPTPNEVLLTQNEKVLRRYLHEEYEGERNVSWTTAPVCDPEIVRF